jgi:pimeloyl-ACP methyl ester carboxylesterase
MPRCLANGVVLYYEIIEPPQAKDAPTLLLIMGMGSQLIAWPDSFCRDLADRGFRVIRFDNRDTGLSQKMDELGTPDVAKLMLRVGMGRPAYPPYELGDMSRDALGLLDALGIERAHVVGASMGGMIAQIMAATYPERVLSQCLIMTTSGSRKLPQPVKGVVSAALNRPKDKEGPQERRRWYVSFLRSLEGSLYHESDEHLQAYVDQSLARAYHPDGAARQTAAILTAGDRSHLLSLTDVPTLVIHGSDDPLTLLDCGKDVARKIPGARLVVLQGMGHNLPSPLLKDIAAMIHAHTRSTEPVASAIA